MRRHGPWLVIATAVTQALVLGAAGVPWLRAIYESLAMFLLGGDSAVWADLGAAGSGHAPALVAAAWTLRFLAPALAGGALLDFAARLITPPQRAPGWWRRHVIVVGSGRLGAYLAGRLRQDHRVVLIERNPDAPELPWLRERGVRVIAGDAREVGVLERAGIARAAGLVATTGHDLTNISAGLLALSRAGDPRFEAHVHVADARLVESRLAEALPAATRGRFDAFSIHDEAARALFAGPSWPPLPEGALVVIAGYGRFGRAVLRQLLARPDAARASVLVVDREAAALAHCPGPATQSLEGDVLGPELESRIAAHRGEVRCLVCTDNDATNIAFALELRSRLAGREVQAAVFTRMFEWPEALMDSGETLPGIQPISVIHLAENALREGVTGWFGRAGAD